MYVVPKSTVIECDLNSKARDPILILNKYGVNFFFQKLIPGNYICYNDYFIIDGFLRPTLYICILLLIIRLLLNFAYVVLKCIIARCDLNKKARVSTLSLNIYWAKKLQNLTSRKYICYNILLHHGQFLAAHSVHL